MRIHLIHPNITYTEELDWHVFLHVVETKDGHEIGASIASNSFIANAKCGIRGLKVTKTVSLKDMLEGLRQDGDDSIIDSFIEQG